MAIPYEEYGLVGRCPIEKDANIGAIVGGALRAVGRWGARQGRATKHFGKLQVQMVDPRKYKGHYFGRARQNLKTGWGSLSPKTLFSEGQKFVGRGQLHPATLAKSKKFLELQKSNPSYADKIMSSVKSATEARKGVLYNRGARTWLAAPSQTWGQAWQAGGKAGAGQGVLRRAGHRAKAMAEEASRRGWTGSSGVGKYAPVGGRGLTAGFIGYGATSGVAGKLEPGETRLGRMGAELGSNLGYVAAAPLGLTGLLGTSIMWGAGGEAAGSRIAKAVGQRPKAQPRYQPQQSQYQVAPTPEWAREGLKHSYAKKLTVAQRRILAQASRATAVGQG